MRDLLVVALLVLSVWGALTRPWLGVLALALFAYLNPHRYAWGFSTTLPVYQLIFISTIVGMFLHPDSRRPFPWYRETILFFLLLIWFTFTTYLFTPDYSFAAETQWMKVMKIYIGIFPTFFLIRTRQQLFWLIVVISASFGFIGLKGGLFALKTGFNYRVWGPSKTFYEGNNEIALALNMMLPLYLLCRKEFKNKHIKLLFMAMFIFSIFAVISTHSRGGLITLVVIVGMILFLGKKKGLVLIIPLILLVVSFGKSYLPDEWTSRMETIETYDEDASFQGRVEAWNYAIERASINPLSGGGFETFMGENHDAHSAYFEILGEHGYIALFLWLNLLFGTMIALQLIIQRSRFVKNLSWMPDYARALQLSLLAYATGSLALGTAYWDIFYHLISLCVLLKIFFYQAYAMQVSTVNS